ncbi:LysE/ArgO family amino acid transporter [Poseidonocella sp. HB161398]|uniref:LysE/ArgO family amino acid transporter n=1 Tax=Poseidonocella sp. HB161398 TaxID=2320855 RepID=UPI001109CB13|nr:LysE/ArgO family amino acid transporter [Poseidonocella sp. HB161398]
MTLSVYLAGLGIGLSLIVAIGAQNAFVLRQGLRGEHVLAVCLACALSDAVLILLGVAGFARITAALPGLDPAMRWLGAGFLVWQGWKSARAALGPGEALLAAAGGQGRPLAPVLSACLAFTWLNPHVYLDTVVLLGTVSTQFPGQQAAFAAGAMTGSLLFFFALGYGAAALRPVFASPAAWRALEASIALVMWAIAAGLLAAA